VISQGIDLGVNGQVGHHLNLSAGYTYTAAKYVAGLEKGERYATDTPRHSLRLAAQYQVPDTGWSAGGNVAATSGTYSAGTWPVPHTMRQGTLVLIGLNAKYQITPQAEVQLGVSNLTDRRYRNLDFLTGAPFGEPRKFTANLKYRF
jgi:outer membrane receptor for ferric coprogen and ferric-rhodotorulic acid